MHKQWGVHQTRAAITAGFLAGASALAACGHGSRRPPLAAASPTTTTTPATVPVAETATEPASTTTAPLPVRVTVPPTTRAPSLPTTTRAPAPAAAPAPTAAPTTQAPVTTVPAPSGAAALTIANFMFQPASLHIPVGGRVTVTNTDSATHTWSSDSGDADSWDSGDLSHGAGFSHTFTRAGTFTYHCNIHSFMTGSVTVG